MSHARVISDTKGYNLGEHAQQKLKEMGEKIREIWFHNSSLE